MNEPKIQQNRRDVILKNVRENARVQSTAQCRENYFQSCTAHGGEVAEVVEQVRKELSNTTHELR